MWPGTAAKPFTMPFESARDWLTSALRKSRNLIIRDENEVPNAVDDPAQARAAHDAYSGIVKALREQRLDRLDGGSKWKFRVFRHGAD